LDTVAAAGHVGLVVGNIPDIAATPGFQAFVSGAFGPDLTPFVLQITTDAVSAANVRIESLAEARHVPVVDLFGLTQVAVGPLTFGGVPQDEALAPDYFHPDTVGQGILGNTVLEALHAGYHTPFQPLRLSDQEILALAGIDPARTRPRTYFDVSPYAAIEDTAPACWEDMVPAASATPCGCRERSRPVSAPSRRSRNRARGSDSQRLEEAEHIPGGPVGREPVDHVSDARQIHAAAVGELIHDPVGINAT